MKCPLIHLFHLLQVVLVSAVVVLGTVVLRSILGWLLHLCSLALLPVVHLGGEC
jgi:hypothetical protein